MNLVVQSPPGKRSIFDTFLMKGGTTATLTFGMAGALTVLPMTFSGGVFTLAIPDDATTIDLAINTVYRHNGHDYPLLTVRQRFVPQKQDGAVTGLTAGYWQKIVPGQVNGLSKTTPPLHPLLQLAGATVTLALDFLDITTLFMDMHADTPWFAIIELLAATRRTIKVLAAVRGNPLVWYVVIPAVVAVQGEIRPNILYFPADYGGFFYEQDKLAGLTTRLHDTSFDRDQSGAETLFSFLTRPVSDAMYPIKLKAFLALSARYDSRAGTNPRPLHHMRTALTCDPVDGKLVPDFWSTPFGFEDALERNRQVLLVPQVNVGDVGIARQPNLKATIDSAINTIYTTSNVLTYERLTIKPLVLTCYSQSGGNVFTAAKNNQKDVRAIVCFEAQYMNEYLQKEDKSLTLGKQIIPALLRDGAKVAVIGRRKAGWDAKYLPAGVDPATLILLPDEANYFLLDFPDPAKPFDPARSPVLVRRYSRLLNGKADPVLGHILGADDADVDSALDEAKVDALIAAMRARGMSDEQVVKAIFTGNFNREGRGGFFTHNFIVSGSQPAPDGALAGFFDLALQRIG